MIGPHKNKIAAGISHSTETISACFDGWRCIQSSAVLIHKMRATAITHPPINVCAASNVLASLMRPMASASQFADTLRYSPVFQ